MAVNQKDKREEGWAEKKKDKRLSIGKGVQKRKPFHYVGGNVN
jgi:hypothetical protein